MVKAKAKTEEVEQEAIQNAEVVETTEVEQTETTQEVPTTQPYNPFEKLFKVYQRIKKLGVNAKAEAGKFSYDYVSLGKFKDVVDPVLEEVRLGYTQPIIVENEQNILTTQVYDVDTGVVIVSSQMILKPRTDNNPQDWGSVITYFRRYALFSIFGIIGDKDDDCLLSSEEIKSRVATATTVKELMSIYKSLRDEQQAEFKDLFSARKKEIEEEQAQVELDILGQTDVK